MHIVFRQLNPIYIGFLNVRRKSIKSRTVTFVAPDDRKYKAMANDITYHKARIVAIC